MGPGAVCYFPASGGQGLGWSTLVSPGNAGPVGHRYTTQKGTLTTLSGMCLEDPTSLQQAALQTRAEETSSWAPPQLREHSAPPMVGRPQLLACLATWCTFQRRRGRTSHDHVSPLKVPVRLGPGWGRVIRGSHAWHLRQDSQEQGPSLPYIDFPWKLGSLWDTPQRSPRHTWDCSPDLVMFRTPGHEGTYMA